MKAITTKFHGSTNSRGSRFSATDSDGNRVSISADYALEHDARHRKAAEALCTKMGWKGAESLIGGGTKDGMVFVFGPSYDDCQRAAMSIQGVIGEKFCPVATMAGLIAREIGIQEPEEKAA